MKTKSGIILLFFCSFLLNSCSSDCLDGSGNQVSEQREISEFSELEINGSMKVILLQDSVRSLRIVADDNIQGEIESKVKGNRLIIDQGDNSCASGPITVYVSLLNLEAIEASGTMEIISDGKLSLRDLELDLSGVNTVSLELSAGVVRTSSSGKSDIRLTGQAGSHELDASGASRLDALDFVVGKYIIETSGSNSSMINVLNELEVNSSGSSDVQYRGNPSKVKNDDSGVSSLKRID